MPVAACRDKSGVVALRCLIVDDNAYFRTAAGGLLTREGMVVGVASNATEALARAQRFHPDVTLVDIELGQENGVDLARQLAAAPTTAHSSVILCSAHPAADVAELTADTPALAFLPKSDLSAAAIHNILATYRPA
jgi:CheY-like chemotaxis protein